MELAIDESQSNYIASDKAPQREADGQLTFSRSVREPITQAVNWSSKEAGSNTRFGVFHWWTDANTQQKPPTVER